MSERWEKTYRLGMAKILGSEGKFAINSMVELTRSLLEEETKQRGLGLLEELSNSIEREITGKEDRTVTLIKVFSLIEALKSSLEEEKV